MRKAFLVVFVLLLLGLVAGCTPSASTENGDPTSTDDKGDSAIVGEIIGILTYGTTWTYMPPNNTPVPRTTLDSYDAAIEDKDGNIFLLSAPGMVSNFEYDGASLIRVTTAVAGYTYTDQAPFNDESRDVSGKSRVISHTGIHVSVTGETTTFSGYISGDAIEVAAIEETD